MDVEIFTDGACKGNPGPGGWAALLRYGRHEKQLSGAEAHCTNNQMELRAAIEALKALTRPCSVILTTDSNYLRQGISEWLPNWKRKGWKTASGQPVKNVELWQELEQLAKCHEIQWRWVKGHSGHRENELVDELANQAIAALKSNQSETEN